MRKVFLVFAGLLLATAVCAQQATKPVGSQPAAQQATAQSSAQVRRRALHPADVQAFTGRAYGATIRPAPGKGDPLDPADVAVLSGKNQPERGYARVSVGPYVYLPIDAAGGLSTFRRVSTRVSASPLRPLAGFARDLVVTAFRSGAIFIF